MASEAPTDLRTAEDSSPDSVRFVPRGARGRQVTLARPSSRASSSASSDGGVPLPPNFLSGADGNNNTASNAIRLPDQPGVGFSADDPFGGETRTQGLQLFRIPTPAATVTLARQPGMDSAFQRDLEDMTYGRNLPEGRLPGDYGRPTNSPYRFPQRDTAIARQPTNGRASRTNVLTQSSNDRHAAQTPARARNLTDPPRLDPRTADFQPQYNPHSTVASRAAANMITSGFFDDGVSPDPDDPSNRTPPLLVPYHQSRSSGSHATPRSSGRRRGGSTSSRVTPRDGRGSTPSNHRYSISNTPTRFRRENSDHERRSPSRSPVNTSRLGRFGGTLGNHNVYGELLPLPAFYGRIPRGLKPTLNEALNALPFVDPYGTIEHVGRGVVKLTGIPYNTTKNEIVAIAGPNSSPVNMPLGSPYFSVHIIMDRESGRTLDAYIELEDERDALALVRHMQRRAGSNHRPPKIGDRVVTPKVSSQEELMQALFPYAGDAVQWSGRTPSVTGRGFRGFCSTTELISMGRLATQPPENGAQRDPNRIYDCIMSTLNMFPWDAPQHITLGQRKRLFEAASIALRTLIADLRRNDRPRDLSTELLKEFVVTVLGCVAFSEPQKSAIVSMLDESGYGELANGDGVNVCLGGTWPFSKHWPFLVVSLKLSVQPDVLGYFMELMGKAASNREQLATALTIQGENAPSLFSNMTIDYGTASMQDLTLREVGRFEWAAIIENLRGELVSDGHPPNGFNDQMNNHLPAHFSSGNSGSH